MCLFFMPDALISIHECCSREHYIVNTNSVVGYLRICMCGCISGEFLKHINFS